MLEYRRRYEECGHTLLKIYVGLPLDHLSAGFEKIQWKVGLAGGGLVVAVCTAAWSQVLSVHVDAHSWSGLVQPVIDRYMRDAHLLAAVHRATGQCARADMHFPVGAPIGHTRIPSPVQVRGARRGRVLRGARVLRRGRLGLRVRSAAAARGGWV